MAAGSGGRRLFEERRQLKVKLHFTGLQECNDHLQKRFYYHFGMETSGRGFFLSLSKIGFWTVSLEWQ